MEILKLINNGSKQLKDKNICSHKLDSEILLSEALNQTREKILINLNKKIDPSQFLLQLLLHQLKLHSSVYQPLPLTWLTLPTSPMLSVAVNAFQVSVTPQRGSMEVPLPSGAPLLLLLSTLLLQELVLQLSSQEVSAA
jgi:hypothetical protein